MADVSRSGESGYRITRQGSDGTGTLHGGYIVVIEADALVAEPGYKTNGNIGSFDYQGTKEMVTVDDSTGLTPFNWITTYFESPSYDLCYLGLDIQL